MMPSLVFFGLGFLLAQQLLHVRGFIRPYHARPWIKRFGSQIFGNDLELGESIAASGPRIRSVARPELEDQAAGTSSDAKQSTSKEFLRKMKALLIKSRPDTRYRKILDEITAFRHSVSPREFTVTITKLINLITSSRKLSNLNQLLSEVDKLHEFDIMFYSTAINSLRL